LTLVYTNIINLNLTMALAKIMAAYCPVDDLVDCGLNARTPGSALGPTLSNEYGKTLLFLTPALTLALTLTLLNLQTLHY